LTDPANLLALFHDASQEIGTLESISANELPEIYASLLNHNDHMTVTVEAWHNSLVDVRVLHERRDDSFYAREILLMLQRDGRPVQYGVMRIDMDQLPQIAQREIESRALPLGRILIRRHVLRSVELEQLWRVNPGPRLRSHLRLGEKSASIYGRTARILVAGKPAVQLLEIVTN
jgi:chorismate-pyruvate lyase